MLDVTNLATSPVTRGLVPLRGRIDQLPSLTALDVAAFADGLSYGHSGYVERGFARERDFYRGLVARTGFDAGERVLDLGCGFGRWSVFLAEVNREVAGIDPMAGRLAIARNLAHRLEFDNARFAAGQSEKLPFDDDSFDAAWCFSALHFVERDAALAELRRVLVPGGRLFVGMYFSVGRMIALLCHAFEKGGWSHPDFAFAARALEDGMRASGPPNFATRGGIDRIMRERGFRVTEQFGIEEGAGAVLQRGEAELLASPRDLVARFREDAGFRDLLLADYGRLTRALDYNLNFLAAAA